jgi:predicted MFS family arabinose efflux permease
MAGTTTQGSGADRSERETWALIAGASLISTGLAAYEIVPASVTPTISTALGIESATAGLLVSIMFGTAVVASLPAGAVLDRTNSRSAMAVAVLALFVAGIWGWDAARNGDLSAILASRAIGGVAYVVVWNAGIDVVSRSVDGARRATAVGVFTASGPVGFALGQSTGPLVANAYGWPAIFLAFTGLAVVGLLLFWPASTGLGRTSGDPPSLGEFQAVLRNRRVWLVAALAFLGYALYLFVNSWGSSYLTEELGYSLAVSGLLVAVFPAVGVVSRMTSGVLSDRVFGGRRRPIVLGAFAVVAPILLVFTELRSLPVLVGALLVAGFAIQLAIGLSFTYVRELVEPRVAATAVAFLTSVGLAGAFLAPIVAGEVVDIAGFDVAFLAAGALGVVGIVVAWATPESTR